LEENAWIDTTNEDIPILKKRLRELVQDELGNLASEEQHPRRKRRKLGDVERYVEPETLIRASFFLR
jgi:hypothetical protein